MSEKATERGAWEVNLEQISIVTEQEGRMRELLLGVDKSGFTQCVGGGGWVKLENWDGQTGRARDGKVEGKVRDEQRKIEQRKSQEGELQNDGGMLRRWK